MIIRELESALDMQEFEIIEPMRGVPPGVIDESNSSVGEKAGFLIVQFRSIKDICCPFEVHFGRKEPFQRKFSFFIGRGAEYHNLEDMGSPADRSEIAGDLERFLLSETKCIQYTRRGKLKKEVYVPNLVVVGSLQLTFTYSPKDATHSLFCTKTTTLYSPWKNQQDE